MNNGLVTWRLFCVVFCYVREVNFFCKILLFVKFFSINFQLTSLLGSIIPMTKSRPSKGIDLNIFEKKLRNFATLISFANCNYRGKLTDKIQQCQTISKSTKRSITQKSTFLINIKINNFYR